MTDRVGALLLALLMVTPLLAQSRDAPRVEVRCVDRAGNPIAGAEVHVWQHRPMPSGRGELVAGGPFTSGEDGSVATVVATTSAGGRFDRWVYARMPGKLVGAVRATSIAGSEADAPITVKLLPSRSINGRVVVADGFAANAVTVRVLSLSGIVGDNPWAQPFPRQASFESFESTLPERFDCRAAADGSFQFTDMPVEALLYLAAEGPGLAQAQWFNAVLPDRAIPESIRIEMVPEASLAGTVLQPDGRPAGSAEITLRIEDVPGAGVSHTFRTRSDDAGRFRITGLPGGALMLGVDSPAGLLRPIKVDLAPGERRADMQVPLEAGIEVAGVVLAFPGGKPVAEVNVVAIDATDAMARLGSSRTDDQGRFSMVLPSGTAQLYFARVPDGFAQPDPQIVAVVDVKADDDSLRRLEFELSRKQ